MLATRRRDEEDDELVEVGGGEVGRGEIDELFEEMNDGGIAFDRFRIFWVGMLECKWDEEDGVKPLNLIFLFNIGS